MAIHLLRFGAEAVGPAALTTNAGLLLQLGLFAYLLRGRPSPTDPGRPATVDEPAEVDEPLAEPQPG